MTKDQSVTSAVKALLVLEAMNRRPVSSIEQLHLETGLAKPTLVRLLKTLAGEGYVHRLEARRGYRLKSRVLRLSQGYEYNDEIVAAAIPHMQVFTLRHKWPVTISIFDTDFMVPKYTTMKHTPLTIGEDKKHSRLPVTASAMGLAWLAFRPKDEQEMVITSLARSRRKAEFLARDKSRLAEILSDIQAKGFATNLFESNPGTGIAVPVLDQGGSVASIILRVYRNAVSMEEAIERYLSDLKGLAEDTAHSISD